MLVWSSTRHRSKTNPVGRRRHFTPPNAFVARMAAPSLSRMSCTDSAPKMTRSISEGLAPICRARSSNRSRSNPPMTYVFHCAGRRVRMVLRSRPGWVVRKPGKASVNMCGGRNMRYRRDVRGFALTVATDEILAAGRPYHRFLCDKSCRPRRATTPSEAETLINKLHRINAKYRDRNRGGIRCSLQYRIHAWHTPGRRWVERS